MRKSPKDFALPTVESLGRAALRHLARYAASEAALRRVLENRIRRAAMRNAGFAADKEAQARLRECIPDIIAKHTKSGALNDVAFAETKLVSLRRAGRSKRAIQQKLAYVGVKKDIIQNVFENDDEGEEIKAAASLARRRRLGVYRKGGVDPERRQKDVASLARAGFSLDIARKVLDGYGVDDFSEK
jgi:regulatory protein